MALAPAALRYLRQDRDLGRARRRGGRAAVVRGLPRDRPAPAVQPGPDHARVAAASLPGVRVLVVDNVDSFVYNLVQYLGQLGAGCEVRRSDRLTVPEVARLDPAGVLISPGPGTPERAGVSLDVIRTYAGRLPILGVCLGHQAIGVAYGATVAQAPELRHGKTSAVYHGGTGVLAGLPSPFTATRYHSLAVREETLPDELEV